MSDGYAERGYNYLIIDDCWSEMERGLNGEMVASKKRFPDGMKAMGDYVRIFYFTSLDKFQHAI